MTFTNVVYVTAPGGSTTIYLARNITTADNLLRAYVEVIGTEQGVARRHWRTRPFLEIDMSHCNVEVHDLPPKR